MKLLPVISRFMLLRHEISVTSSGLYKQEQILHFILKLTTALIMSNDRLSVALENGRFAKVTMWQNEPRLDLRQWEIGQTNNKPTKKGISLKTTSSQNLKQRNGVDSRELKEEQGFEVASGDERLRFGSRRQPLC